MEYIIKDLVFKKKENIAYNCYVTRIKIHDIFDVEIKIIENIKNATFNVDFFSHTRYNCFTMCDEPCHHYTKYGFATYRLAYNYANKEIKSILNNFISSVLADIDDYIEEIGEI